MNKFLAKTIGKWKIWTAVAAVFVIAGIVVLSLFGFNKMPTADSVRTLTVRFESYASSASVEKIEEITTDKLRANGLSEKYSVDVELASGKVHEYVYTFKKDVNEEKLNVAKDDIKAAFDAEKQNAESPLYHAFVYVNVNEIEEIATLSKGFVWRGILAGSVFVLAVFAYVSLRRKWLCGLLTFSGVTLSTLLATALVALCRIPVTATVAYAFAFTMLFSTVLSAVLVFAVKDGEKEEENKDKSIREIVLSSMPVKSASLFVCVTAVALVLVGAIAITPVAWLAVAVLVGLVASVFVCGIWLPAVYLPVATAARKKAELRARYDYKKKSKKTDKKEKEENQSDN